MRITSLHKAVALLLSIFISACASPEKKQQEYPDLDAARYAYAQASHDIAIVRHAAMELDEAQNFLLDADRLIQNRLIQGQSDYRQISHLAYLASQKVKIARMLSQRAVDRSELASMVDVRQSIALNLRQAELDSARSQTRLLQQQLEKLEARATERGMVMTLGDVLFEAGESRLAPAAVRKIKDIALFMRNHPQRRAVIEGHSDNRGRAAYNRKLSRDRAFAVLESLLRIGVPEERLSVQGYGEKRPLASNYTAMGRKKNRRVEVVFPEFVLSDG